MLVVPYKDNYSHLVIRKNVITAKLSKNNPARLRKVHPEALQTQQNTCSLLLTMAIKYCSAAGLQCLCETLQLGSFGSQITEG